MWENVVLSIEQDIESGEDVLLIDDRLNFAFTALAELTAIDCGQILLTALL